MNEFSVMDVETSMLTHGETPRTKFWGFFDGNSYRTFETTKQFAKYLKGLRPQRIYHHFNFDVLMMLADSVPVRPFRAHHNRIIESKLYGHTLLNSYSIFPCKLESILNAFGYKKEKLTDLKKRNYGDCVYAHDCFGKLAAQVESICGVNPLTKRTIAGVGMAAAKLVAGKLPVDLRFLKAYRGGRVECYDLRPHGNIADFQELWSEQEYMPQFSDVVAGEVSKFDINSSYPQAMVEAPKKATLYKIKVKCGDFYCPFFDARRTDKLVFPNGEFTSYVFADNYERYIKPNCEDTKIKIMSKHIFNFEWLTNVRGLVADIFAAKRDGNLPMQLASKLLINSLYGRMGLRPEREAIFISDKIAAGSDVTAFPLPSGEWLSFVTVQTKPVSNYPMAAYITDNARARLYASFVKTDALYGDTDSTFTKKAKSGLQCGQNLGQWKDEGRESFQAYGVKDYQYGGKEVRKGGSSSLVWTLRSVLGRKPVVQNSRERKTSLDKRRVLSDGRTSPLNASDY